MGNFRKITEESSNYNHLEQKKVDELLRLMNREDQEVPLAVAKAIPQIEILVEKVVERMSNGGRLFYVGAGTSGRLGVLDASELPPTFGVDPTLVIGIIAGGDNALRKPIENAEDCMECGWNELLKYQIQPNDTVIGIAASGTTPYVYGTLLEAKKKGILTASITCNPNSPISVVSDVSIELVVGPEFVTGSTRLKAGTAQKLVLNMISTVTMIKLGRVKGNKMVNMQLTNDKLFNRGVKMLMEELCINQQQAAHLLSVNGSVKKAMENFKGTSGQQHK